MGRCQAQCLRKDIWQGLRSIVPTPPSPHIKAFGRYRTKEDVLVNLAQIESGALPQLNPQLLELALGER